MLLTGANQLATRSKIGAVASSVNHALKVTFLHKKSEYYYIIFMPILRVASGNTGDVHFYITEGWYVFKFKEFELN